MKSHFQQILLFLETLRKPSDLLSQHRLFFYLYDGSFKCHEHSPSSVQHREQKIKFLKYLDAKMLSESGLFSDYYPSLTSALSDHLVQIVSAPPSTSCLSLSQLTSKCSYLSKGQSWRSRLLNTISSLLSRTFLAVGRKNNTGKEDINLLLSVG